MVATHSCSIVLKVYFKANLKVFFEKGLKFRHLAIDISIIQPYMDKKEICFIY